MNMSFTIVVRASVNTYQYGANDARARANFFRPFPSSLLIIKILTMTATVVSTKLSIHKAQHGAASAVDPPSPSSVCQPKWCSLDKAKALTATIRWQLYVAELAAAASPAILAAILAAEQAAAALQQDVVAFDITAMVADAASLLPTLQLIEQAASAATPPLLAIVAAVVSAESALATFQSLALCRFQTILLTVIDMRVALEAAQALANLPADVAAELPVAAQMLVALEQLLKSPPPSFAAVVAAIAALIVELTKIEALADADAVADVIGAILQLEYSAVVLRAAALSPVAWLNWAVAAADVRVQLFALAALNADAATAAIIVAAQAAAAAIRTAIEVPGVTAASLEAPLQAIIVQFLQLKFAADIAKESEVVADAAALIAFAVAWNAYLACDTSLFDALAASIKAKLADAEAALILPADAALKSNVLAIQLDFAQLQPLLGCCETSKQLRVAENIDAKFCADIYAAQLAAAASVPPNNVVLADCVALLALAQEIRSQLQASEECIAQKWLFNLGVALQAAEGLSTALAALYQAVLAIEQQTTALAVTLACEKYVAAVAAIAQIIAAIAAAQALAATSQLPDAAAKLAEAQVYATNAQTAIAKL